MRMRRKRGSVAGTAYVVFAAASGCWGHETDDCEFLLTCTQYEGAKQDGGAPARCVPQKTGDAVPDACGLFVASRGDDTSDGTKQTPVKTLATAIAQATKNRTGRVYACAEEFEEAVEVPAGVTLYGALDCANDWRWVGATRKTTLTAAQGTIPLRMRGGDGAARVRIEDVLVRAHPVDGSDLAMRGTSSIAALAEHVSVELVRCVLEAGDAAPGAMGEAYRMSAMAGAVGNQGNDACSADVVPPGGSVRNDCGTPDNPRDDSDGGLGGNGSLDLGGDGSDGTPGTVHNGGAGEFTSLCRPGTVGSDGIDGDDGAGATGVGLISASGYTGVVGLDGTRGSVAQGGGGGGGSKGGTGTNQCRVGSAGGASGGSGGSGGCGGAGGKAGGPGGSSLALISLNAALTFEAVTLKTGSGGAGGRGSRGQPGGRGGNGAHGGWLPVGVTGLHVGCAGGPGGIGGTGGTGGGGLGGHSIGIAYVGAAPLLQGVAIATDHAGAGGTGADAQHNGAAGLRVDVQAF